MGGEGARFGFGRDLTPSCTGWLSMALSAANRISESVIATDIRAGSFLEQAEHPNLKAKRSPKSKDRQR